MYLKPAGASVPFSRRSPFRFPRAGMIFFLSTHSWVFCISFAVAIIFNFHVLSQALTNEGVALLSFKQSITDDPRNFLNNWNALDETPCAWNGVTCIGSKVVSLSIPNMKLTGFLPPIFGNLSALRHLNLRNNNLSGALQVGLFGASGLQSLVLSGNSFSGSIPSEIEKLSLLHTLDFSYNIFNGSLPASFVRCRQLKTLNLSKNGLSGSLPDGFGTGFTLLEHLSLSFNKFSGSIPVDLGNLSSLTGTLDLSHNLFNGAIPASLGNLSEEVYINLCYNNLSGPIPQNGALLDAGPTAFAGNPLLCGAPLKLSCPPGIPAPNSQTDPSFPSQDPTDQSKGGNTLSKGALTLIVASAMFGSCFLGWFLSCMCKRYCDCKVCDSFSSCAVEEGAVLRKENFCFGKEALDVPSEMEQHEFVSLDLQVDFDLDKLLKASAFLLGKSGTGIVYKVVLEEGPTLAVRRLGGDPQRLKDFQTEVEAIAKIKHPNIVPLRAYSWSSDEKLLVYDFISNGDLSTAIHGKVGMASIMPLSWSMRLRIMKGMAKALAYIHEFSPRKYVHGDLKPGNILLGKNMEPYIADFGISGLANFSEEPAKFQLEQILMAAPEQSSPYEFTAIYLTDTLRSYYQPPEASQPTKPSQKWDVYSFGMILLEMVTGRKPIVEVGPLRFDLIRWVQVGIEERTPISEIADPSLLLDLDKEQEIVATLQVALACVHKSPEKRPSMRHVLNSLDKLGISSGP